MKRNGRDKGYVKSNNDTLITTKLPKININYFDNNSRTQNKSTHKFHMKILNTTIMSWTTLLDSKIETLDNLQLPPVAVYES